MELKLGQSDSHFHVLFNMTPDPVWIIQNHRFVECNNAAVTTLGYHSKDDLLNTHPSKLSPEYQPDGQDSFSKAEQMMIMATEKGIHRFEWVHTRADGSDFFAEVTLSSITLDDSPVLYCVWRDITARKQSEISLRNNEARQHAITSAFPDLVFLLDEDGRYLDILSTTDDLLYKDSSEILGKTIHQIMPAESADIFLALIRKTLDTGEPQSLEYSLPVPKGLVYFDGRSATVNTRTRGKRQVIFVARDITERKQTENELIQFKATLDKTLDCVFMFNPDTLRFFYVNLGAQEMVGYSNDELLNMTPYDIKPEYDEASFRRKIAPLISGELNSINFETLHRHKDGHLIPVEVFLQHINPSGHSPRIVAMIQDISKRKQLDDERHAHRKQLEALVAKRTTTVSQQARIIDQSHDSIISTDLDAIITSWNNGAEKLFGLPASEVIGEHINILYPPDELEFLQHDVIEPLLSHGQHETDVHMCRSDRSIFDAHLSLSMMYDDDGAPVGMICYAVDITERNRIINALRASEENLARAQAIAHVGSWHYDMQRDLLKWSGETYNIYEMDSHTPVTLAVFIDLIHDDDRANVLSAWQAALTGEIYNIEHRIVINGKIKWVREQADIRYDSNGQATSALGTIQDITEQKEYEIVLRDAKQKAEVATKAKSAFLANMSHEIRTPLNAVLGFARMGLRDSQDTEIKNRFGHIQDSGQHLLSILNDILDLSKLDAGKLTIEKHPFHLKSTIDNILNLVKAQVSEKDLTLSITQDSNLPDWVMGDALRLHQILLNLLCNSVKFTSQGEIKLHITSDDINVNFSISDTGIGMDQQQISRLFTPFTQADSSTTRKYGGSGLGLTISQNLARLMHGKITVRSESDRGSTFTLTLPLPATSALNEETSLLPSADSRLTGIRVLAAEDIELNQAILKDILESEGASVSFANNGQLALEAVTRNTRQFDLVLMDIQMPVMDGYEATREILKIKPDLPVIGLTAHALAEERDLCQQAGMVDHVTKPINTDILVNSILTNQKAFPYAKHNALTAMKPPATNQMNATDDIIPDSLPGIDIDDAMKRMRGKWSIFKKLLLIFRKDYASSADKIAALLTQQKFKDAELLAHSIKGVAGNLGARQLQIEATTMEQLCRELNKTKALAQIPSFRASLELIVSGLNTLEKN